MKFRDILLETEAAAQAKQLGLEKKPGWGNYGPVGQDVITHQSRDGRLIKVQTRKVGDDTDKETSTPSTGGKKRKSSSQVTDRPASQTRKEPKKPKKPKTQAVPPSPKPPVSKKVADAAEERKERAESNGGARKLGSIIDVPPQQKLIEDAPQYFEDAWSAKEVTLAVGQLFGSDLSDTYVYDTEGEKVGKDFSEKESRAAKGGEKNAYGAFNSVSRNIWLNPKLRPFYKESLTLPPEEWTMWHYQAHVTMVHESIHASSPRLTQDKNVVLRPDKDAPNEYIISPLVMQLADTFTMEEGLTEYLARQVSERVYSDKGVRDEVLKDRQVSSYRIYVEGVRLMATYGGLDPVKTFQTATDVKSFRKAGQDAEDKLLSDLMKRELGVSDEKFDTFLAEIHLMENRDKVGYSKHTAPNGTPGYELTYYKSLAVMTGYFQALLTRYVELARAGNYTEIPDDVTEELLDAFAEELEDVENG